MPQPPENRARADQHAAAYAAAWATVTAAVGRLLQTPLRARSPRLQQEIREAVKTALANLDPQTRAWAAATLPAVYGDGAMHTAAVLGSRVTAADSGVALDLASQLSRDLLAATSRVTATTKALLRRVAEDEILGKLVQGRTAVQAARRIELLMAQRGVYAVRYANGALHGLDDYAEMATRTVTALAYNRGLLGQGRAEGVKYYEIFDGPSCGLATHDDLEKANGLVVSQEIADTYMLAHPSCQRSFGARPDIRNQDQADIAEPSTTEDQRRVQREVERVREEAVIRRSRTHRTTTQRRARLDRRRAQLDARISAAGGR